MLCLHAWRAAVTYSACVVWCHGLQLATTGREKPVSPMSELATQWAGREEGREERGEDEAGTRQGRRWAAERAQAQATGAGRVAGSGTRHPIRPEPNPGQPWALLGPKQQHTRTLGPTWETLCLTRWERGPHWRA